MSERYFQHRRTSLLPPAAKKFSRSLKLIEVGTTFPPPPYTCTMTRGFSVYTAYIPWLSSLLHRYYTPYNQQYAAVLRKTTYVDYFLLLVVLTVPLCWRRGVFVDLSKAIPTWESYADLNPAVAVCAHHQCGCSTPTQIAQLQILISVGLA